MYRNTTKDDVFLKINFKKINNTVYMYRFVVEAYKTHKKHVENMAC